MDKIEALAESWASIEGKLERFRDDKNGILPENDGTYDGFMLESAELERRLNSRGFKIVPV
ncbi:MAG: hypothetical protein WC284_11545 [Candidimonas sp.]